MSVPIRHDTLAAGPGERRTPWHREPYAWLVFGLPASVVLACLVTIVIAINTSDVLVVDDYYKAGLEINRVLAREEHAARLALAFDVTVEADRGVALALVAGPGFAWPDQLDVRFTHATRGDADHVVSLRHAGDGRYRGSLDRALERGPWYVDLSTTEWRVVRRIVMR